MQVRTEIKELERIMLDAIDGAECAVCKTGHMRETGKKPWSWTCDKCEYNLKYLKG